MTPSSRIPRRPIHLLLDFDGTLTKADTLSHLASIGYDHNASLNPPVPPWSSIVSAYLSDLSTHTSSYPSPPASRRTLSDESAWLGSLESIEKASFDRAFEAGIWHGITMEELDDVARKAVGKGEVRLRRGWEGCVERVLGWKNGSRADIVSANWSRMWIWGCLRYSWKTEGTVPSERNSHSEERGEGAAGALDAVSIFANEVSDITASSPGSSSLRSLPCGEIVALRTAIGKLNLLRKIRVEDRGDLDGIARNAGPITIYVGDSNTDLLCLVEADVGICIQDENMGSEQKGLKETCERVGVNVLCIGDFVIGDEKRKDGNGGGEIGIWWAREFVEVEEWIAKLMDYLEM